MSVWSAIRKTFRKAGISCMFAGTGLLLLPGCAASYIANPQFTPLFTKDQDGMIGLSLGTSQVNIQGAYSPSENFFLVAGANGRADSLQVSGFIEGGAGFYHTFREHWRFECQMGIGYGRQEDLKIVKNGSSLNQSERSSKRLVIQPAIAREVNSVLFCVSNRFSYLDTENKQADPSKSAVFLTEPAFTVSAGRRFRGFLQSSVIVPLTDHPQISVQYLTIHAGLGIGFPWSYKRARP